MGGARGHGTVQLVNSEELPFSFSLDKATYDASEQQVRRALLRSCLGALRA